MKMTRSCYPNVTIHLLDLAKEVRQIIQPDGTCLRCGQNFERFNKNIRKKGSIVFVDVSRPCHDLDFGGFALDVRFYSIGSIQKKILLFSTKSNTR
jgi:hypothetical protein